MSEIRNGSPTREQIEARAYELYLQRGEGGHELEDWLKAEEELKQRSTPQRTLSTPARSRSVTSGR
jgi:Protein of unknown function (DUF2934)